MRVHREASCIGRCELFLTRLRREELLRELVQVLLRHLLLLHLLLLLLLLLLQLTEIRRFVSSSCELELGLVCSRSD